MKKTHLTLLTIVLFTSMAMPTLAITEILNASACSGGTSCDITEYTTNDTGVAHTIAKGATGIADTWNDSASSAADAINAVRLRFRHSGEAGIDGSWTIVFRNEAGSTTYCTNTSVLHAETDSYATVTPADCSWTAARLDDLEIAFTNGDSAGPDASYIYFAQLEVEYTDVNSVPYFSANLADSPDPIFVNNNITFTATGTDPDTDPYILTICRTNSISNGYPGSCNAGQNLCNSTATSSGAQASCTYNTSVSDAGTLTTYAFLCDATGECNTTSTSTTTTVNQYGWLNVSNIVTTSPLNVSQNATFTVNASVRCAGGTNALCGTVNATARYNPSGGSPDRAINITLGHIPLYNVTGGVWQLSPQTLENGEEWNFSLVVNFTGVIGSSMNIDVLFNSTTYFPNVAANDTTDRIVRNVTTTCDSAVPGQNWEIWANDSCTISGTYNVLNISIIGNGTTIFRDATITSTGCAIRPTPGRNIVVAIEPTTIWLNAC